MSVDPVLSLSNQQLYFLGSLLSFYFPYDFCLFHEMDAVLSYGLRYIPITTTGMVTLLLFSINKLVNLYIDAFIMFLLVSENV